MRFTFAEITSVILENGSTTCLNDALCLAHSTSNIIVLFLNSKGEWDSLRILLQRIQLTWFWICCLASFGLTVLQGVPSVLAHSSCCLQRKIRPIHICLSWLVLWNYFLIDVCYENSLGSWNCIQFWYELRNTKDDGSIVWGISAWFIHWVVAEVSDVQSPESGMILSALMIGCFMFHCL